MDHVHVKGERDETNVFFDKRYIFSRGVLMEDGFMVSKNVRLVLFT